jgi:DNA-binding transcriptional LysR family regulator
MDYRDHVFLAVAENLSFSRAAAELFISQPAVTKHIKELESKLNIALFHRKGNKIHLTEAGKLAYNYLQKIEQQYHELEFELGRLNDTFKGVLRIGSSSSISQYLIPSVLGAFHKKYPKIELFLYNGNSYDMEMKLLQDQIDLALVENMASQRDIQYVNFYDDEILVVAGSNSIYAKNKAISMADFQQIPVVLREKGSGTLDVIQGVLNKLGIRIEDLNVVMHLGSTEAIKNFITEFDGLALVSEKSVEKELLIRTITTVEVKKLKIHRKFRMASRQGPLSFTAKLFKDFLLSYNK